MAGVIALGRKLACIARIRRITHTDELTAGVNQTAGAIAVGGVGQIRTRPLVQIDGREFACVDVAASARPKHGILARVTVITANCSATGAFAACRARLALLGARCHSDVFVRIRSQRGAVNYPICL